MSFSLSDKKDVERILSSLTSTMDAIGKAKRDVNLAMKIHRDWPTPVFAGLMSYYDLFSGILSAADGMESALLLAAEKSLPIVSAERLGG